MSKRKCVFNDELKAKYPAFQLKSSNTSEVYCKICSQIISIANKGRYDLDQHLSSKKHKNAIQAGETAKNLSSFLQPATAKTNANILECPIIRQIHK